MIDDIVQRLRWRREMRDLGNGNIVDEPDEIASEAADEIERLRALLGMNPRGETVPVQGIRLRKDGEYTVVDAEMDGEFVEVIREHSDGPFSHIVEPTGMLVAAASNKARDQRDG
jgi:hypothetical protein